MRSPKVTVGLIGAGAFGVQHLRAFTEIPNASVAWICDPDDAARAEATARFRVEQATSDYQIVLDDPNVDLIDIVAPNYLHAPIAIAALRAGKHVLCEKPMARTSQECEDMLAAARATDRQLFVKYHHRFEPAHRRLKHMWEDGAMPRAVVTMARRIDTHLGSMLDPHHWRGIPAMTGGGCLFSSGSHTLDLLEYVFGPAAGVTATNRQLVAANENKADDNATVVLEFASGMVATFIGCWTVRHVKTSTLETFAEDCTTRVRSDGSDLVLEQERAGGVQEMLRSPDWFWRSNVRAIQHFVDCAAGIDEPLYSAEECARSLRTLEAAYRSSAEGRRIQLNSVFKIH